MTPVLALHASAVSLEGDALIFLGPPGTGKTTIAEMAKARFTPLAYEAVYLTVKDGVWYVTEGEGFAHFETPSWQEMLEKPHHNQLRGIVRLYQATDTHCRRVSAQLTGRYLTDAFFELVRHRQDTVASKKQTFAILTKIAREIPGYELYFGLSETALDTLETIFIGVGYRNAGVKSSS